jgi:uncharacterized protein (DUF433 family)
MPNLDWSKCPVVESVPGKVSGAWVLKGTRMPVSAIFENIEAGASIDDILEWFEGLDRTQVQAILEFDSTPHWCDLPTTASCRESSRSFQSSPLDGTGQR